MACLRIHRHVRPIGLAKLGGAARDEPTSGYGDHRQPLLRLARGGVAAALLAAAAATRPATAQAPEAQVVQLRLTEWHLIPETVTVAPGTPVRLIVANDGLLAHALAVEGEGVYAETGAIGSGETATLDLTFTLPGRYELYCPLAYGQHRALGQEAVLLADADTPPCAGSSTCLVSSGKTPGTMEDAAPPAEPAAGAAGDTVGDALEAAPLETPDAPATR